MKTIIVVIFYLFLCSCSSIHDLRSTVPALNVKNYADLNALEVRLLAEPDNLALRARVSKQREHLARELLETAAIAFRGGDFISAEKLLDQVELINPASPEAKDARRELLMVKKHQQWLDLAQAHYNQGKLVEAEAKLKALLIENPSNYQARILMRKLIGNTSATLMPAELKSNISKPITLEFKQTSLRNIFEMISRSTNINFIFDKEVMGETNATIFVRNTKIEEAMRVILVTNKLAQKVLSENTILIYPNTPEKNKEYQELLIRNFYLVNVDVKQMVNVIKTIAKSIDITFDEKLNMLTVRDTPEVIMIIEKLIAAQDMAEPEVMLELEVLEVGRTRLQELGVRFPERLSFSAIGAAGPGSLTIAEWRGLNSNGIRANITDPSLILNLRRLDTDTNLLANPSIRVKNRENAKVHIGERVPVITATTTANVGVSESVTYLDVGLKLDIQPNVHLNDEVAMKVQLEVSNILETIVLASGTQTYRLGTRNTSTTLRLKDGETQILAGLIQDDERKASNKIPVIGNLPIIGKLFSNTDSTNTKTEIVLLITPRIIRNIYQPESDVSQFSSGTASAVGSKPLRVNSQTNDSFNVKASDVPINLSPEATSKSEINKDIPAIRLPATSSVPVSKSKLGPNNVRAEPPPAPNDKVNNSASP